MIQYKKYTKVQGKEFIENADKLSQPALMTMRLIYRSAYVFMRN